jgi:hypothetical protein
MKPTCDHDYCWPSVRHPRSGVTISALLSLPILLLAGACASNGASAPAPTVSLTSQTCTALPDLANAHALTLENATEAAVTLDGGGPCLQDTKGNKSLYAVFRIPPASSPYQITVASEPLGTGLFSPHVLMLDDQGKVLREIPRDSFLFHGKDLSVSLRAHPGEVFLIAASDPQSVGQQVSQISEDTSTTMVMAGPYTAVPITHGSDTTSTHTYAHNGTVKVTLKAI